MPRAELAAVLDAMSTLPKDAALEAVVDASYVVRTGTRIARALDSALTTSAEQADRVALTLDPMYGCNGDLWSRFAKLYAERRPL